MPPRIPSHRVPQSTSSQCFRTRPQPIPESIYSSESRQFHATPSNSTRLRRDMYDWLKGPGRAFRDPLPGSTNYLSAYDKAGRLIRLKEGEGNARSLSQRYEFSDADLNEDESVIQNRELESGRSEEEVRRRAQVREAKRRERDEAEARSGIPPERGSDLRPYPLNRDFQSQSVLSEELREKLWEHVVVDGLDLKSVSATFGVDIRRVAAVVRLKSVEKQWIEDGRKLAKPYNDAIMAMLPQTPFKSNGPPLTHESINDLPVHPLTRNQLFVPVSESREFTRADAAKAFHPKLLPADQRIPHPELVQIAKWEFEGHERETRQRMMREMDAEAAAARELKDRKQREWEERTQVVVKGRRWDFKFEDITVSKEKVGKDGKGRWAVGHRYGMPLEDRKKGQIKIPTSVE